MNANEPTSPPDLYEVLQVSPIAEPEVIAAAYERLSKKYREDPLPEVRERRRLLDRAYAVLSDRRKRADYDQGRRQDRAPTATEVMVDTAPPQAPMSRGVVACPRDPAIETALRCSRCETPICPKCLVQTPVGARCRDCARISRSPIYTLSGVYIARAIGASLVGGIAMGLVWGYLNRQAPVAGFISFFVGAGLGYAFTKAMDFATNRKRGTAVISITVAGIGLAWAIQFVMMNEQILIGSLIALGVAIYFAYQNLRYL